MSFVTRCSLCKEASVESLEFEGGNNAELSVTMGLCETHLAEYDKDEYAFQDKYADQINTGCYDQLVSNADALRDRQKYEGKEVA